MEHARELVLRHATHHSVSFQLLIFGLSVDSEILAEELLIQLQVWLLGDVLVFVHPGGVVNFDQLEINLILCLFETLLQEHLLADVIIEDLEPPIEIQDKILTSELIVEGFLRVLVAILKAHKIEDFTSLGINNAFIPILRVEDLDGISTLKYFKLLVAGINLKLFEVRFGIRLFVEYYLFSRFLVLLRLVLMFLVAQHDNTEIIEVEWVRIEGLMVPLWVVVVPFVQDGDELPLLLQYRGLSFILPVDTLVAIDFVPCFINAKLDHLGEILVEVEVLFLAPLEGVNEVKFLRK